MFRKCSGVNSGLAASGRLQSGSRRDGQGGLRMRPHSGWLALACLISGLAIPAAAPAQLVQVGSPLLGYGYSSYQNFGLGFSWMSPGGNLHFSQNGLGSAIPPFGGYDPNASARLGFGNFGPGGGFRLGLEFGQGSTRTITSVAPSLMVQNGGGGSLVSGVWTPFVTGWIPVVGDAPGPASLDNAVTRAVQSGQLRLDNLGASIDSAPADRETSSSARAGSTGRSTAETATESVAAIRARQAAERAELAESISRCLEEFEQHRAAGRIDLARLALNRAIVLERDPARKQPLRSTLKATR